MKMNVMESDMTLRRINSKFSFVTRAIAMFRLSEGPSASHRSVEAIQTKHKYPVVDGAMTRSSHLLNWAMRRNAPVGEGH